ncbi:hypothetical protein IJ103_02360 [Candidatus Saccharibacteria bacterium]|nr:hypothetical protein [Candidatus Saccharibacteria bacterium]MBQ9017062.1 hypothetical protein [Candidatus Saccharibacteria bacterium]
MALINTVIVPTILAADQTQFGAFVAAYQGFAKRIQIDITDGQLAPTLTLPENQAILPEGIQADYHMMVARPSEHLQTILQLKPHLCIFHAECGEDLLPLFTQLKSAGIKAGVALMKQSFPAVYRGAIEGADHVLIFAGELGRQGSEADLLQTEKVDLIRAINPNAEIGWDGGANLKNVRAIAHAGVDVINVGSAIAAAPNPQQMYEELQADLDKKGVVL